MQPVEAAIAPTVTAHFWSVSGFNVARGAFRMASQRRQLRKSRGCTFAKLLGTGSGETFSLRDADPHTWAVVAAWDSLANARIFATGDLVSSWNSISTERASFLLRPTSTRGEWARRQPFEPVVEPTDGRVVAITRARIRFSELQRFASFVPPVAMAISRADGVVMRTGIGEAPFGLQGTFSLWQSAEALKAFAYGDEHRLVIDETRRSGWYAEELFARFNVLSASGTFKGIDVNTTGT